MGGIGAAVLGELADWTSIEFVYRVCSFLPMIGLLTVFLPYVEDSPAPRARFANGHSRVLTRPTHSASPRAAFATFNGRLNIGSRQFHSQSFGAGYSLR
jgi:hypothetical protein